jgi:DDE superfamily endonuclease
LHPRLGEIVARAVGRGVVEQISRSVAAAYPGRRVHVIWDNLDTHCARAVWQAFNARHGERFHFRFTPLQASWVNQIELWFARYTRRVLRHASHTSTAHLRQRTEQFIRAHNQAARQFNLP